MHRGSFSWTAALLWCGLLLAGCQSSGRDAGSFSFAVLTDTHVGDAAGLARFRQVVHALADDKDLDFVLVLGDLCAQAPEYLPQMREVIEASPIPVRVLPGNHDDDYGRSPQWYTSVFEPRWTMDHKGYRFIANWSQVPDAAWVLRQVAQTPPDRPTILCQHYPPRPQDAYLAPFKTMPNLKLVMAGHEHRERTDALGTVPVWVMDNAFMDPDAQDKPIWYVVAAGADGRMTRTRHRLEELNLRDPADHPPSVAIDEPQAMRVLAGTVRLSGTAADDQGVAAVEYSVDLGPWRPVEGTEQWRLDLDTTLLPDGHHSLRVRAVDVHGQPSIEMAARLHYVGNQAPPDNALRFQQGVDGYEGCSDLTLRRGVEPKSPNGPSGDETDLETWVGKGPRGEWAQSFIRFDLSGVKALPAARIKRVGLVLFATRQNGMQPGAPGMGYRVHVLAAPFPSFTASPAAASPAAPATRPGAELKGVWPYVGARQILLPPAAVEIDLTPMKDQIAGWLANPASNFGLSLSPEQGRNYNLSARGARWLDPTLRPMLRIELE